MSIFTKCILMERKQSSFKIHIHYNKLTFWSKKYFMIIEDEERGFIIDYKQRNFLTIENIDEICRCITLNEVIMYLRNRGLPPVIYTVA